ncbi:uncharacterized protein LOC130939310 [Arachis stenosperma]|uniref:uncharacterized protein LOC130939310 n=1 Tax=Arachis stenosperma TaxID=217475 RepID=UPI0025AB6DF4|nr:uncharacterized protein LOC130939310 [Arachis stenosperma]
MSMNSSIDWNWDGKNLKQGNARLEYQEFEPSFDWIWDDEKGISDTLAVFLPGFKEEQSRVEITSNGLLRLSGERKIGEAIKIRRFEKELAIPSDTDTKSINTKFENDILYVKLPRVITTSVKPPPTPVPQQQMIHFEYKVPDYEYVTKERVMDKEPLEIKTIFLRVKQQPQPQPQSKPEAPATAPNPTTAPPAVAGPQQQPQPQLQSKPEAPIDPYQDQEKQRVMDEAPAPASAPIQTQAPPLPSLKKEKEKEEEKGQKEEEKTNNNNNARKVDNNERRQEATMPSRVMEMKGVTGEVIDERLSTVSEKSQEHGNGVYRWVEDLKKHKTRTNLGLIFLVLLLVLYVNNVINSYFGGERP